MLQALTNSTEVRLRVLTMLLRIAGGVMLLAFPAIFLPVDWMAATHQWLGLGEFPRTPIVDYLARSASAIYGFHGVLLLAISQDPARYHRVIRVLGVMNIIFGVLLVGIDVHAGLPVHWTMLEGPPVAGFGVAILWLIRGVRLR
jgi:hypothetical protein